jgi:hypothetical protein
VVEQGGALRLRRRRVEVEERRAERRAAVVEAPGSLGEAFETLRRATGAGQRRTSDRGMASYSPPFPSFPSFYAKLNTQTPNVGYLYSDLTF